MTGHHTAGSPLLASRSLQLYAVIFVSLILPLSYLCPTVESTHFIYVSNSTRANDTPACWSAGDETPCRSISYALKGVHDTSSTENHPGIILHNGTYELTNTTYSVFNGTLNANLRNVAILGNSGQNQSVDREDRPGALIHCKTDAGLTFFNVSNVTIERVVFMDCGVMQHSTSKISSSPDNCTVAKFRVAVFLVFCENVSFRHVWVEKTPGTGVVIYATKGYNSFQHCQFLENYVADQHGYSGGGGLYLEFPYRIPTFDDNCEPNVPLDYVSNSHYLFQYCNMSQNTATVTDRDLVNGTFILPHENEHMAFGRGGGLSVFFKGNSTNNTVIVSQSYFLHNQALWGAGMFAEFQDNATHNQFQVYDSLLESNRCPYNVTKSEGTGGGGTRFGYLFFDYNHVKMNSILFDNCTFSNNTAYYGGGVSFYVAREVGSSYATNTLTFSQCMWYRNKARVGAAMDLSVWHPVSNGSTVHVKLKDITIAHHNDASNLQEPGAVVGLGAMYIDTIPVEFDGYIDFHDNYHTALAAISSQIDFQRTCVANFTNNRGRNGGALALFSSSFIRVHSGTQMSFTNNRALFKGGAIFSQSAGEHDLLSSRNCFIRYESITVTPQSWNATFAFTNNTADGYNNSIYTTTLLPCLWGGAYGPNNRSTGKVFCWSDKWHYDSISKCSSEIKTDPASFKCHNSNCTMRIIPGQRKELPVMTTDDLNNTATNRTVLIAYSHDPDTALVANSSKYIADNSLKLYGVPGNATVIELYTQDPRALYMNITVQLDDCPPGFVPSDSIPTNDTKCICHNGYSFNELIKCSRENFTAHLQVQGIWIGKCEKACDDKESVVAGYSPYTYHISTEQMKLPRDASSLTKHFCQHSHRKGTLCGDCMKGYGAVFNSHNFECKECSGSMKYSWVFFLLTEMLPQTVLFAVLVLFNISLTSGPANAFILFAQVISTSFALYTASAHYDKMQGAYTFFYGIWNLNFFDTVIPSYCLSAHIRTATLISLDYIVALYPLILIGFFFLGHQLFKNGRIVYCVCLPLVQAYGRLCKRYNLRPGSSAHALSAFLLLSYTKFTIVSVRLLSPSILYNATGHIKTRVMFYDGTIKFFQQSHIPYIVAAILVLIVFVSLPPLILLTYPVKLVRHLVNRLTCKTSGNTEQNGRLSIELKYFLDSFYGCYKDGSAGTRDLRWFAGLYFVFRIVFAVLYALNNFIPWAMQYTFQQIVCTVFILLIAIVRPYKNEVYNYIDLTIFGILTAINALSHYNFHLAVVENKPSLALFLIEYILIWLPLLYMVSFLVFYGWAHYRKINKRRSVEMSTVEMEIEDDHISDNSIMKLVDDRGQEKKDEDYVCITPTGPTIGSSQRRNPVSTYSRLNPISRKDPTCKDATAKDRPKEYGSTTFKRLPDGPTTSEVTL